MLKRENNNNERSTPIQGWDVAGLLFWAWLAREVRFSTKTTPNEKGAKNLAIP
jgi:hypothetical protein